MDESDGIDSSFWGFRAMPKPYSDDLRERLIEAGVSRRDKSLLSASRDDPSSPDDELCFGLTRHYTVLAEKTGNWTLKIAP
jgi:hypothetical protein